MLIIIYYFINKFDDHVCQEHLTIKKKLNIYKLRQEVVTNFNFILLAKY